MWNFLFQHWSEILDVVYKCSGIALVIGLLFAYQQYKKTTEQTKAQVALAKITAKREAICLAARQCEYYGRELMRLSGDLRRSIAKKCQFLEKAKVTITENQVSCDPSGLQLEDKNKILEFYPEITHLLNSMEGFSIYFASNVADDNIGYIEYGKSFVKHFEEHFALYSINNRTDDYYKATQALYWRWKNRLKNEELVKQHEELTKQMSITRQKIDPTKLKPSEPFGT